MASNIVNLNTWSAEQISNLGKSVNWIQGRDIARVKTISYSGYDAIYSMKTTDGDWSQGVYANNVLYWIYTPDSQYNSNNNSGYIQMKLDVNGYLTANKFIGPLQGNADTATMPLGFASRTTGASWGNIIGTSFTSWNDSTGGSIDFRQDNPLSGRMSIKVDGRFYGSEGTFPAMLMNSDGTYWGMGDPDASYGVWIRTTTEGIIPSQSGPAGYGHCSLGTSTWYFSQAYIDIIYGNLSGNATTSTSTRYIQCRDTRSTNPAPSDFASSTGVSFDFKQNSTIGLNTVSSETYSGVMTYRPYGFSTDWSGGPAHQIAFDAVGLYWRTGSSSWNRWYKIFSNERMPMNAGLTGIASYGNPYQYGTIIYSNGISMRDPYTGSGNDCAFIRHIETTTNSGYLEIGVGDDGTEPILCRQYNTSSAVVREAYLLTGEGHTALSNAAASASYQKAALQIREANFTGSGSDIWGQAPRLAWHWSGRVQAQIGLASNNHLYISEDNFSNSYRIVMETGTWGINVTGSSGSCTGNAATASQLYVTGSSGTLYLTGVPSYSSANQEQYIYSPNYINNGTYYGYGLAIHTNVASYSTSQPMGICYGRVQCYSSLHINANTDNSGDEYVLLTAGHGCSSTLTDGFVVGPTYALCNHGPLHIYPRGNGSSWNEGLRIHPANNGWATLIFCGSDNTGLTGTSANSYSMHAYQGNFYIARNGSSSGTSVLYCSTDNYWRVSTRMYGAVWNDYAEARKGETNEGGRAVYDTPEGIMKITTERMQAGARLISDTYGFLVGESEDAHTPIGVGGRVLAFPYQDRNNYKIGDAVCAAPNGTVDIMTREEIKEYPDRIIGIVSEIPDYEIWENKLAGGGRGSASVEVCGRIWIYVR